MVAIRHQDGDRFIDKPPAHVFLFLIYGTDAGLISERRTNLLQKLMVDPTDPFQLVHLHSDRIAADPPLLLDEANSISMFGSRKAIVIDIGAKSIVLALEALLKTPPIQCSIVMEAGALKRDAPLRKLVEREKCAAAIECYPDRPSDIEVLVREFSNNTGIAVDPEASTALSHMLGADRLTTRSELEKLFLYAHSASHIGLNDVETIVADASALVLDTLIYASFSGNQAALDEAASKLILNASDANVLMAFLLRHATAMHRATLDVNAGVPPERAIQMFFRTGSFLPRGVVEGHLRNWTATRLEQVIANIAEATAKVRLEPSLAVIHANRCLWTIARIAGRGSNLKAPA